MDYAIPIAFLLGMRHALEPDHLAAVTMLTARNDPGQRGLWIGATWGLGHGLGLLLVGLLALIVGRQVPPQWSGTAEVVVAVILVALGVEVLIRSLRQPGAQGGPTSSGTSSANPYALGVGMVHGVAGSGALLAMTAAAVQPAPNGLAFLAAIALGAAAGMAVLSSLLASWLRHLGARSTRAMASLRGVSGASSAAIGAILLWNVVAIAR